VNRFNLELFVVLCEYPHKNQRGLELKIILSIENDEEPSFLYAKKGYLTQYSLPGRMIIYSKG